MTDLLTDVRNQIAGLTTERDQSLLDLGNLTSELSLRLAEAQSAAAQGDAAAATRAKAAADVVRAQRRDLLGSIDQISAGVVSEVAKLLAGGLDPCDAEADVPLVLLPVRLETRFSDDGATLRVRIQPDDAHVDRLDAGLSDDEQAAGIAYWIAVFSGGPAAEDAAWSALVVAVHRQRAAWVANTLTPTNLADRPNPPAPTPLPDFPIVVPRTLRAPIARSLPDRFVLVARQAGRVVTATGSAIPPEVVVGFARDDDPSTLVAVQGATLGPGMEWMVDYDEAERIGLAVTLTLPSPGEPVDLLMAVGVRSSLAPDAGAAELGSLLQSHRYAEGSAFVPQGTPTNNTETDRTNWTVRPDPAPPATTVSAGPAAGSNADVLSRALGIAPDVLDGLPAADLTEQGLAAAANCALWEPSWGTFLDRLTLSNPSLVDDVQREALRDLFEAHVRGRGPLPALRLGNQPYGVLPVSNVEGAWLADPSDAIEGSVLEILRRARRLWDAGIGNVPTVMSGAAIDDELLDVLGSAPQLLGLRVRSLMSESACLVVPDLLGSVLADTETQRMLDLILWQTLGLPFGEVGLGGSLGKTTRPVGLPLVADTDGKFIDELLSNAPRQVTSVLQALLELAYDAAQNAVSAAAPTELLPKTVELATEAAGDLADPMRRLVEMAQGEDADPGDLRRMADRMVDRVGPAGPTLLALAQPVAALRSSLAHIALSDAAAPVVAPVSLQAMQAWFRAQARLAATRAAMTALADPQLETADRGIAVAETLDCASHRFDAWTTALVTKRLEQLRSTTPSGTLIGAYGWVVDLAPGRSTTHDGGYVLAPSVAHAATAGVLRSAYLHHNPDATGDGAFAIDLSSARVRDAKTLLDGIRNGQPLGALLGYRFERELHESSHTVNRFVLSLRALAPLVGGRLTTHAEAPPRAAQEAVAATDVVDGVSLLAQRRDGVDIRAYLGQKPANNPYLTDPWVPPSDDEWTAISGAMDDIESLYDATSDLLLAEAVHQLVQGNTARAAATLDAAAGGDAVPVDPQVAQIPARGAALTHRSVLLLGAKAKAVNGWASTPRSQAEPRLEAWVQDLLGPAHDVVLATIVTGPGAERTFTLADASLCALDVVHDALTPGLLERRLRAAIPELGTTPIGQPHPNLPAGQRDFSMLGTVATSIGRTIAGAQVVLPDSFARAGEQSPRQIADVALTDFANRVQAAIDHLNHLATRLAVVLSAPAPGPVAMAALVAKLAGYGIPMPKGEVDTTVAAAAVSEATRRVDDARAVLNANPFDAPTGIAAGKVVFGDAFSMLPVVSAPAADLFSHQVGRLDLPQTQLRRFVRDVASVRAPLSVYADTLLHSDATGVVRHLAVVQLAAPGTSGAHVWLGGPLDLDQPSPSAPVTSLLVEGPVDMKGRQPLAGLVLDEWVEVLPTRSPVPGQPRPATRVTAGLAANVDVPDARAPQSILLAVSPDGQRWTTDTLVDVIVETLSLAKVRAVTLERTALVGRILPALQEQSWSLQGEETLDLSRLVNEMFQTAAFVPFVKG